MNDAGPQELSWGSATRFDRLDRGECFCRRDRVERFAEQLDNATGVQVDSTKLEQLDALYKQIGAEKGRIDVLLANAGGGSMLPLGDITESHYDETFDRNVKGVLFTVQKALPLLAKHASVILTGSTAGSSGTAAFSVYSASKAAVRAFARSWILDLKDRNVRVNTISPGATRTPGLVDLAGPDGPFRHCGSTAVCRGGPPPQLFAQRGVDRCAYTHMMGVMKTSLNADLCHCFAARRHARLLTRFYDRHLGAADLSISQFSILAVVHERPQILIAELAELMVMERTTLVRALKPLQTEHYLLSDSAGPRTAIRLSLSARGEAKLNEAERLWQAAQKEREEQIGTERAVSLREAILEQGL